MIKNIGAAILLMTVIHTTNAQKGFKPIFDGKTTAGWHNYGKTTVGSAWKVDDGVLHFDPSAAKKRPRW